MTTEMVERVARALAEAELGYPAVPHKGRYKEARAAIKAMMEPTPYMMMAGSGAMVESGRTDALTAKGVLETMLTAALEE